MTLKPGITYMHEHVTIDLSSIKQSDDTILNCFDATVAEFKKLYARGVRNVIDATVAGMGGDALYVQKVAAQSGINIVQATGFYVDRFFPPMVRTYSIDELAEFMLDEIYRGIGETDVTAGIIGEIGTSKDGFTPDEEKVFRAAAIVHQETDLPITTHATLGTFAMEQVLLLKSCDVNLEKVVIGHVDLTGDAKYVLNLLEHGVYVAFDTIGKINYQPDETRCAMLKAIQDAGHIGRVVLSMDITRPSNMEHKGGIGYCYLLDTFVPMMREHGVTEESIVQMLETNPMQFFGG